MIEKVIAACVMPLSDLSVVVLSYNRKAELVRNLPGLCEASARTGFELTIVDNSSTDGSLEVLSELYFLYPSVKLILNSVNLGVAGGRNAGWRMTTKDYILNLDDDTWIDESSIFDLLQVLKSNHMAGVVSPRIIHAVSLNPQCDFGSNGCEIANFHGACHLVRSDVYKNVGDIDSLCAFGGEELDFSIRVRVSGRTVIYTPLVTVKHNSVAREGDEGVWRRKQWIYNFTRIYFKHFPLHMALLLAFRYCLSHMLSGGRRYGCIFAISLIFKVFQGALAGRREYIIIPKTVKNFYNDRKVRPEFGNVPIWIKIFIYFGWMRNL